MPHCVEKTSWPEGFVGLQLSGGGSSCRFWTFCQWVTFRLILKNYTENNEKRDQLTLNENRSGQKVSSTEIQFYLKLLLGG